MDISIHALVKRATGFFSSATKIVSISIHALVTASISIHALVERATYGVYSIGNVLRDFNPRPRKEGDVLNFHRKLYLETFQSTPS